MVLNIMGIMLMSLKNRYESYLNRIKTWQWIIKDTNVYVEVVNAQLEIKLYQHTKSFLLILKVMVDYYLQQTIPLLQAGLKVIAYETVPSYKEAMAILKAVDSIDYSYHFWISFSCKVNLRFNNVYEIKLY